MLMKIVMFYQQFIALCMSFVLNREQKKSIFSPSNISPGPASYQVQDQNVHHQSYAPFNSSKLKVSQFDIQKTDLGPASYSIQQQYCHKQDGKKRNICHGLQLSRYTKSQSRNQNQQSSQLPSIYHSLSPRENSAVFNKKIYDLELVKNKSKIDELRRNNNQNRVQSIKGKRQFIHVLLTNCQNKYDVITKKLKNQISYDLIKSFQNAKQNPKRGFQWKKNKVKRFKSEKCQGPGPADYCFRENNERIKSTAAFCSSQIRSHMDSLIYKTNIPLKVLILQKMRFKDNEPWPGTYNISELKKQVKSSEQQPHFGSGKRQVFEGENFKNPGPSYYHKFPVKGSLNQAHSIAKQMRSKIFVKNARRKNQQLSFLNKEGHIFQDEAAIKKPSKIKFSLKERCCSNLGNMSQVPRFKMETIQQYPGPASYEQKLEESNKKISSVFNSCLERNIFQPSDPSPPFYNLEKDDISSKMRKIKSQNKIVRKGKQQVKQDMIKIINGEKRQKRIKKMDKKEQQWSPFKSKTKRRVFSQQSGPGPAEYQKIVNNRGIYQQLEKKSFNQQYKNKNIHEQSTKKQPSQFQLIIS